MNTYMQFHFIKTHIRIICLMIVFLAFNPVSAQDSLLVEIASFDVKLLDNLYGVSNQHGDIAIFYSTNEHNYILIYNERGTLIQSVDFRTIIKVDIRGFCFQDKKLSFYYSYENKSDIKEIKLFRLDVITGDYKILDRIKIRNRNEHFIASVNKFNTLYFLYYLEKPDRFLVKTFKGDEKLDEKVFDSKIPNLEKHINKLGLRYSYSPKDYNTAKGSSQGKFYISNSELTILFDGFNIKENGDTNKTEIVSLNLKNNQSTYYEIPGFNKSNTYLFDKQIFRLSYDTDQFELSIYDFHPLNLRKKFVSLSSEKFDIINVSLFESGYTTFNIPKKLDAIYTSEVLNELKSGKPVISVKRNSTNSYNILMGSYQISYGPPIMSTSTISNYGSYSKTEFERESVSKYFELTLSADSLNKVDFSNSKGDSLQSSISDQINTIKSSFRHCMFNHPQNEHMVYFDKKSKLIKVIKLTDSYCEGEQ